MDVLVIGCILVDSIDCCVGPAIGLHTSMKLLAHINEPQPARLPKRMSIMHLMLVLKCFDIHQKSAGCMVRDILSTMCLSLQIELHLVFTQSAAFDDASSFGMVSRRCPVATLRSALLLSGRTSQGNRSCSSRPCALTTLAAEQV